MKRLSSLYIYFIATIACGQSYDAEIDLQSFIEEIFQVQDEDIGYEDLYESLFLLYTNPVNLNEANQEDLQALYVLSQHQVTSLLDYRNLSGPFISIYELQAVPGFDLSTIRRLLPFVTLKEQVKASRPLLRRIVTEENNFLLTRIERTLEKERGFKKDETDSTGRLPAPFAGDRNKVYTRYRVSRFNDFSLGFTMEKDQGEEFNFERSINRYGPDFISFHFLVQNQGKLKSIAIGDYQLQLGQGLLLGAGFNPGKGSETITTIRRSNMGIRPYSSVLESGFFRGVATTYNLGLLDVTGFYSNSLQDGNIRVADSLSSDFEEFVSSIQDTGLHRTPTELENKDQVREKVIGTNLTFKTENRRLQAGLTFLNTSYSVPIFKRPNNYNRFEFQGTRNYNIGGFANFLWENINFFGEAAASKSGGLGMTGGLVASFTRNFAFSLALRNYQRDFHSFYGNAFGEGSRNINERGIYWGVKFTPLREVTFTAYYDKFSFPWLRFRAEAPSDGYEYLARLSYRPSKNLQVYGQVRRESKERNINSDDNLRLLAPGVKNNYLINFDYQPMPLIDLKSRIQWSAFSFQGVTTRGFVIIQDLNLRLGKIKIGTRFALFDTDDFENRQFAYEKDVLYAFSIPAYNGVGIRNYLLLQYKLNRKIAFWARLARTSLNSAEKIGSGFNEIKGERKTDLKVQLRYKF